MKKVAFLALEGALGYQIKYILNRIPKDLSIAIVNNAKRVYGAEYTDRVLHNGMLISFITTLFTVTIIYIINKRGVFMRVFDTAVQKLKYKVLKNCSTKKFDKKINLTTTIHYSILYVQRRNIYD